MAKYDVFISYSRKDTNIANQVCEALTMAGISFFIDRKGISGGMEFPLVIAQAICDSKIFLFLASKNSYESKFTNNEITFAFNEKPRESILPYIIDGSTLPLQMRFIFAGINWRNSVEHPINTVLIQDLSVLLGTSAEYSSTNNKPRIITKEHANSIGNICASLSTLPSIINGLILAKSKYKAVIRMRAIKKIPNKGTAIVGEVCVGKIEAQGCYEIKLSNHKSIQGRDIMFWNITESEIGKSPIILDTMKKYGDFSSEYECYMSMFSAFYDSKRNGLYAKPGDIVGIVLSGVTPQHLNGCTHLFRI